MKTPGRRIALTGVPRSGTTLCCQLLGGAEDTVALFEPMEVHRLPRGDRTAALDRVGAFFEDSRSSLLTSGRAFTQQVNGVVPDNPFASHRNEAGQRAREAVRGEITVRKPLSAGFALVIKHNAAFTALLPELASRFETYAVVRNPLAVLASWHSVDLPVSQGRLPAGEWLEPVLEARLANESDRIERQLAILDWLFVRYGTLLPRERVVAYEEVVASGGEALARATGVPVPGMALQGRNVSRLYDAGSCALLAERLLARGGAWQDFYRDAEIEDLATRLATGAA